MSTSARFLYFSLSFPRWAFRCGSRDVSKVGLPRRSPPGDSTTNEILQLRAFLEEQQVTTVVMEATSDYWKPFYYLLESSLPVMLVNAKAARNIPGRKTDVSDASWLAQLGAHGLLRASFVPPAPIRELRDLTRARAIAVQDRTREIHRLEKFLEGTGIKLSSVVSNLTGVSSRAMLEALISGERDPEVLAQYARQRMRSKIPELVEGLTGRFGEHQAFMVRVHLDQIDHHTSAVTAFTDRIEMVIGPFHAAREALITIPGVSVLVADVIIAETGADMSIFPHLGAPGLMGRRLPWLKRVCRTYQIHQNQTGQQLPESSPRYHCVDCSPTKGHVPLPEVAADRCPTGSQESSCRD